MTGLYPPRHGIYTVGNPDRGESQNRKLIPSPNKTSLDPDFPTLPQQLQDAGYTTCIAGKWHLSDDPRTYGFDTNFGGTHAGHPASYFSPYNNAHLPDGPPGEHLPARLAREVAQWISAHQTQPFFVYFPFYSVHTPVQAREDLTSKYQNKTPGIIHTHAKQAAMIEAMDQAAGRVLKTLDSLGIAENTIVIFTADNGPAGVQSIARPLRGSKGMYYEGGIREPFFVRWPGVTPAGSRCETPIIQIDLFPTFLEMAGIARPAFSLDGQSLVPLLRGDTLPERPLFWHFPAYLEMNARDQAFEDSHDKPHFRTSPCSVVRLGEWKLIEYFENGDLELYHLPTDPSESANRAGSNPKKRDQLHRLLRKWQQETAASIPTTLNPDYRSE
jgi:arylsulfatase A-like enzyme